MKALFLFRLVEEKTTAAATTGFCKLIVASFRSKPIMLTCSANGFVVELKRAREVVVVVVATAFCTTVATTTIKLSCHVYPS